MSVSSLEQGKELQTAQTNPDTQVMQGTPQPLCLWFLSWSSYHHLFSSPALKFFPSSSLRQICSLYHIFALWHQQSRARKSEESSPEDSESLPLGHFQSNWHLPERHTLCTCLHTHVQLLFITQEKSLREKNNYADFGKSSQAITPEEVPNPALEKLLAAEILTLCWQRVV